MSTKRKTRASESAAETPDSKRRKATSLESAEKTQGLGYQLLDQLKTARDKRHRLISVEFATLPDKDDVPDYYDIIELPIAFDTIETKLNELQYPTTAALESDFLRLVSNAKTYNERDSEIYSDAEKIRKLVQAFMTQHNPAYNDPGYTAVATPIPEVAASEPLSKEHRRRSRAKGAQNHTESNKLADGRAASPEAGDSTQTGNGRRRLTINGPRSTGAAPQEDAALSPALSALIVGFEGKSFQEAQEILLDDLLDYTNDEGVEISGPFANLPPRDLRDYYQVIKKPASLRSVQKKVKGQKGRDKASGHSLFTSWRALEDDLNLIWNNARLYNEENSEIYAAAGELETRFYKRLEQAKKLVQEPPQPKVTLRVGTKEAEPSPKLKLHLSSKHSAFESNNVESDAPKRQRSAVSTAARSETRATSQAAEDSVALESKPQASSDSQADGVKAEKATSQSPPAPLMERPTSSASRDNTAPVVNGSILPATEASTTTAHSPGPAAPQAPPPPPLRDPLEARLRTTGKGVVDALITSFVLCSHPSISQKLPFRLTIPPSEKLSQQTTTITLPEPQRQLRLHTTFPAHLFQRPHRIIVRLNREYLQPVQDRADEMDPRSRAFDVTVSPSSVNVLDVEVLASLTTRGAPKTGSGSEYDYERTTVYVNVVS